MSTHHEDDYPRPEHDTTSDGAADRRPGAVIRFPTGPAGPADLDRIESTDLDSIDPDHVDPDAALDRVVLEGDIVRVDDPAAADRGDWLAGLAERSRGRRPIVAPWLRSRRAATDTAKWVAAHAAYVVGYHVSRLPKYAGKLAVRAPRGLGRTVGQLAGWVFDTEGLPVRLLTVQRADPETYLKLSRQRDARVRLRVWVGLFTLATVAAGTLWVVYGASGPVQAAVVAALVGVFGHLGRPADRPLIDRAVVPSRVEPLTSDIVVRALGALGIAGINQALSRGGGGVHFPAPITRDGPGWRADVDLPYGVTVGDIMDRRPRVASGLRRPLGCVWPEGDSSVHEGRLILWVGDRDLSKTGPLRWTLARAGQHDTFNPVPFGADHRGRAVAVPLIQHNILIGSLPGQGKTSAVRVLACGAALDPTCELWIHEVKGSGDLDPLETVCHRYVSGIDDESIGYAADSLALLRKEVMRRTGALKKLPREACPDKRVTRAIANRRGLGLHPLVCVVDECQNLFAHPQLGEQAGSDAEFIIKIGRAFGVVLILATQRPDKDSLPTGVSGNVSIRFCLKVAGQVENDMILGTSAYKNGVRATAFRPEIDAGIGYLSGATATPVVVRTAYLDGPATERIAERARAAREAAGTLSGHAIGQATARPETTVLDDLAAVFEPGEDKAHSATLAARLAERRPDLYAGWGPEQLSGALKPHGITTRQVWAPTGPDGASTNRMGVHRDDITTAITDRNRRRSAG
jgi:S-DNA-T family DNA segregation ATPase FtsK/SpoIIIE